MTKITKAEFETLPESLKAKFKADGDDYVLQEEDVDGLKKSKAEILEEKKKIQAERDELAKFKADREAEAVKAQEKDLEAKGKYEEAIAAKEKAWNERFEAEKADKESLFADIKRERLTNELVKRGALADRAGYLVGELDADLELVKGESGKYELKKKGGIGDAAEFDSVIEAAKAKTPFFFAANGASGSGASGSQNNGGGGNGKTISRAQYEENPMAYAGQLAKRELTITD
jgi:hypothetical protein